MSTEGEAAHAAAHERPVLPLPRPGDVLGDYRIVRELGRGGMGVVWLAEQVSSNRRVALKVLLPRERPTAAMLARFRREGQLAAAVSHPCCVFVFAADEVDGLPFIAMEAMPGRTLQSLVQERGRLPIAEAVDFALQLIDGLEAAAAVGVIHRDVKPSNCFLSADGGVKIGDFGLSKSLQAESDLTATGSFVGTPLYASPEQVRGKPLDLRSDIYSLGATLYYLIAGEPPITRAHAGDLLTAIAMEKPAPLRRHRDRVPPALERIVRRMLAKDPAQRFADYGSLRRALEPYASGARAVAPGSWRVGAYLLDLWLLLAIAAVIDRLTLESLTDELEIYIRFQAAIVFLYFLVTEGLFQRSPGKALVGLRVSAADGTPLAFRRAAFRLLVYWILTQLPYLIYLYPPSDQGGWSFPNPWHLCGHVPLMLSFGGRRGSRGLHELLSGTRVFLQPDPARHLPIVARPAPSTSPAPDEVQGSRVLGPYELWNAVFECPEGAMFSARDRVLDRSAWILVGNDRSAPLSDVRKNLFRPSRLRWLQGGETVSGHWDAFEAATGTQLLDVGDGKGMPWREARRYLLSLARELHTAGNEDSLPAALSLKQVHLLPRGEIQLLDHVPLDSLEAAASGSASTPIDFLRDTASVLLTGRLPHRGAEISIAARPAVPHESLGLFRSLDENAQAANGLERVVELLERLNRSRHTSRALRFCTLLAPAMLLVLTLVEALDPHPEFSADELRIAFWTMHACRNGDLIDEASHEASRVVVSAARHWPGEYVNYFGVELFPDLTEDDLLSSEDDLEPESIPKQGTHAAELVRVARELHKASTTEERRNAESRMRAVQIRFEFWTGAFGLIMLQAFLAAVVLASAWALRGGVMHRVLGLQLLDDRGRSASRLRCAFRALCAWGPSLVLAALALGLRFWMASPAAPDPLSWASFVKTMWLAVPSEHLMLLGWLPESIFVLSIAVLASGAVHAIYRPDRPLPERMSGTRLVPRS